MCMCVGNFLRAVECFQDKWLLPLLPWQGFRSRWRPLCAGDLHKVSPLKGIGSGFPRPSALLVVEFVGHGVLVGDT